MAGDVQALTIDQVKAGQKLPELPYDCSATTVVLGALATRDWRPMHHDRDFAQNRNRVRDIFLNTPNLAHWFERYLTDWTGPKGRPGRMKFFMRSSVFAGDHMVFQGEVVLCYGNAYEFTRQSGETWQVAFARKEREIEMPARRQGETLCFGADGRTLFLTSEKQPTPLFRVAPSM